MERRIGAISIIVKMESEALKEVNRLLSHFWWLIIARMDIPYREKGVYVLTVIINGTTDDVGAFTGRLGNLKNVRVKSLLI